MEDSLYPLWLYLNTKPTEQLQEMLVVMVKNYKDPICEDIIKATLSVLRNRERALPKPSDEERAQRQAYIAATLKELDEKYPIDLKEYLWQGHPERFFVY